MLGGLHTLVTKSQLVEEYPDNPFYTTAMVEVFVGLTNEEALRLAQHHNLTSHFVHKVSHQDLVSVYYCIETYMYLDFIVENSLWFSFLRFSILEVTTWSQFTL